MERISGELQTWLSGVEQSASQIGKRAGIHGVHLIGFSAALRSRDVRTLSPRLNEIWAGTAEVRIRPTPHARVWGEPHDPGDGRDHAKLGRERPAAARYGGGEFAILPPQTALNRAFICRANAALHESKNDGRDRVSCG